MGGMHGEAAWLGWWVANCLCTQLFCAETLKHSLKLHRTMLLPPAQPVWVQPAPLPSTPCKNTFLH